MSNSEGTWWDSTWSSELAQTHPNSVPPDALIREIDVLRSRLAASETKLAEAHELIRAIQQGGEDANGQIVEWFGVASDISARKQVEQALREREAQLATLTDLVPQFVWMCTRDGSNVYFNQRWVDYTGLTREESYGEGWNTPFHPDDKQAAWDAWNRAVETGTQYRIESRLRAADGTYRWFLMRGEPLRDTAGAGVEKWFGTCTDIEDIKQAENALRTSQASWQRLWKA